MDVSMRQIYKITGLAMIICAAILYLVYFYMWLENLGVSPFGENMVKTEITIIPRTITIKPVTLTIIITILGYILLLESVREHPAKLSREKIYIIEITALILLFVSLYELIFNFIYWNSLITVELLTKGSSANIDLLSSKFPYSNYSWNLVYATKIFFTLVAISILTVFFTNRWLKNMGSE